MPERGAGMDGLSSRLDEVMSRRARPVVRAIASRIAAIRASRVELPTLVFLHVPCTGATAVRSALEWVYAPGERVAIEEEPGTPGGMTLARFRERPASERAGVRFMAGHVPYGVHDLLAREARYVTVARHPVDRVLAMHRRLQQETASSATGVSSMIDPAVVPSLDDWLADERPLDADNGMVRLISGRQGVSFGACTDDMLTEALAHIESSFAAVLVSHLMVPGMRMLEQVVGSALPQVERASPTEGTPLPPEPGGRSRARLRELNSLDMELYRVVSERLPQEYERLVGAPMPVPRRRRAASPEEGVGAGAGERPSSAQASPPVPARISGARVDLTPTGDGTLIFIHIPKSGGTSLRSALAKVYRSDERAYLYPPTDLAGAQTPEAFAARPEAERRRVRLVIGHLHYGVHASIPGPWRYVTMLRDPIDRVISLYYHFLSLPRVRSDSRAAMERTLMTRSQVSLEDWVFGLRRLQVDNGMVRALAGRQGVPFGRCRDDLLAEALENVDRDFEALLLSDEMADSAAWLACIIGRPIPPVGHKNTNPRRKQAHQIDPAVRQRIVELNELDVRLYEIARTRFQGRPQAASG